MDKSAALFIYLFVMFFICILMAKIQPSSHYEARSYPGFYSMKQLYLSNGMCKSIAVHIP